MKSFSVGDIVKSRKARGIITEITDNEYAIFWYCVVGLKDFNAVSLRYDKDMIEANKDFLTMERK